MPSKIYKSPLELSNSIRQVPPYDKDALVSYLKQYGSGFTDDAYKKWALGKGKELKGKPLDPEFLKTSYAKQNYGDATETYSDQYLNDDEWLEQTWPDYAEDALNYYTVEEMEYDDIDDDYERGSGLVDTRQKYDAYLKWKKEGN